MGSAGPYVVALALLRSWRRNLLRSLSALSAIVIGAALLTLVTALSLSIVQSLGQASGLDLLDAELVVAARARGGLPDAAVGEVAAVTGVERAVPAVFVSTRLQGTGQGGNLTLAGLPPEAAELAPNLTPRSTVAPRSGTAGFVVTAEWARRTGHDVGDVVEVATPYGGSAWTIVATVDVDAVGSGAVAVGQLADVRDAFARSRGVDAVFVQMSPGADRDTVVADLEGVAGGRATVGPPSSAVATIVSSYSIVRTVLFSVAGVGVMVGIAVVYICWRLQLLHDRRTLAQLRLVGARSRQLAGGALMVFLAVTAVALVLGIPLGLLGSRSLSDFSVQLASISGFAVAPDAAPWLVPAVVGAAGGLVMGAAAWAIALRPVLQVPAMEALVAPEAGAQGRTRTLVHLVLGVAVTGAAVVLHVALPAAWQPLVLALILVATILLARSVPASVGWLLSRRDDVPVRLSGRHYQLSVRQTAATTTILIVALTFALGLAGLTGGTARGIDASVEAWTGGDLFVEAGEPGSTVRDQRLDPALADRLLEVEGVDAVSRFALNQVNVGGRLVPVYSWNPDPREQEGFVDLDVTAGARGDRFWEELAAGDVAVTQSFARQHDLALHDELPLPTPEGVIRPRIEALVSDFLSDSGIIYTSMDVVEQLGVDPGLTAVGLRLDAGADPGAVAGAVERIAQDEHPSALVWSADQLQDHLRQLAGQLLLTLKLLSWATELLAIIVACTTIATAVASRRREYGLIRLCGAAPRLVQRQLRAEHVGLGVLSWIITLGLGTLAIGPMGAMLERFSGLRPPFVLPTLDVAIALLVALAGSVAAAWGPTRSLLRQPVISLIAVGE